MSSFTRRNFVKTTAATTLAFNILPDSAKGANERIALGAIGIGGKGAVDTQGAASAGAQVVALCDVADPRSGGGVDRKGGRKKIVDRFPDAKFYLDFREMIANEDIDAVTVSTPDHTHCLASSLAMKKGCAVYCQKPLSHDIWEARYMTELAASTGVQTQMGNQAHAGEPIRRAVELIRSGLIGKVSEVHTWTNRPIWPQGLTERPPSEPVPVGLDWDKWIGTAPMVDFSTEYAPFAWRGWWDWGTGALGDMGCHIMDMPYWALELGHPKTVNAEQEGNTELSGPTKSTVTYTFPKGPNHVEDLKFVWYDGVAQNKKTRKYSNVPPRELWEDAGATEDHIFRRYDLMMVGEKGRFFFGRTRSDWKTLPGTLLDGSEEIPKTVSRTSGNYAEWLHAIKTGTPALSNFSLAGPFTETVLLGNLAVRLGKKIEWDGKNLKALNAPEADALIKRVYRKGWELPG